MWTNHRYDISELFINFITNHSLIIAAVEQIPNEESSKQSNVKRRRLRKKYQSSESNKEDRPLPNNIVDVKEATPASDSEDILDEFFMSLSKKKNDSKIATKEDNSLGSHDDGENRAKKDGDIAKQSAPMNERIANDRFYTATSSLFTAALQTCTICIFYILRLSIAYSIFLILPLEKYAQLSFNQCIIK